MDRWMAKKKVSFHFFPFKYFSDFIIVSPSSSSSYDERKKKFFWLNFHEDDDDDVWALFSVVIVVFKPKTHVLYCSTTH